MERQAHVVTSREVISEVECGKVCDVFVRHGHLSSSTRTIRLGKLETGFNSVEFKSIDRFFVGWEFKFLGYWQASNNEKKTFSLILKIS